MIFSETKLLTPTGWKEARAVEEGDPVLSWGYRRKWFVNTVKKVQRGRTRIVNALVSFDGMKPMVLRCTEDQRFPVKLRTVKARDVQAGAMLMLSNGTSVFMGEASVVERGEQPGPEDTYGFELEKRPRNYVAGGILCRQ